MKQFYSLNVSTPGSLSSISFHEDLEEAKQMARKFMKHLGEKNMKEKEVKDCVVLWTNDFFFVSIELETFGEIKNGAFPW